MLEVGQLGGQKTPMELSPSWNLGTRTHLGLKAALWEVTALEPRRGLEIDYRSKLSLFGLIGVRFLIPLGQSYIGVLCFL